MQKTAAWDLGKKWHQEILQSGVIYSPLLFIQVDGDEVTIRSLRTMNRDLRGLEWNSWGTRSTSSVLLYLVNCRQYTGRNRNII